MKQTDIKLNQEYAIQTSRSSNSAHARVRVLEFTTVPATAVSDAVPGVLVEYLENAPAWKVGERRRIANRRVSAPWAVHADMMAARMERQAEARRLTKEIAAAEQAKKAILVTLLDRIDAAEARDRVARYGSVTHSYIQLIDIIERAMAQGRIEG